ncbi:MAG: hypothetical protein CM15mP74_35300 [Halieaceae bacterium]|nr:MAG: hypothetical protein CM15mP74_35300 [Halieaceae bacterium]
MNVVKKTFQYGDHEVTLETGRIARQATGSVMVTMGSTSVLCTVVAEQKAKAGQAFFRCRCITSRKPTLSVRSLAAFSSGRVVPVKRRRSPLDSSTAPFDRCLKTAS